MKKWYILGLFCVVISLRAYSWKFYNNTPYNMDVNLQTTMGPSFSTNVPAKSIGDIETGIYCPHYYKIEGKDQQGNLKEAEQSFDGPVCVSLGIPFNT